MVLLNFLAEGFLRNPSHLPLQFWFCHSILDAQHPEEEVHPPKHKQHLPELSWSLYLRRKHFRWANFRTCDSGLHRLESYQHQEFYEKEEHHSQVVSHWCDLWFRRLSIKCHHCKVPSRILLASVLRFLSRMLLGSPEMYFVQRFPRQNPSVCFSPEHRWYEVSFFYLKRKEWKLVQSYSKKRERLGTPAFAHNWAPSFETFLRVVTERSPTLLLSDQDLVSSLLLILIFLKYEAALTPSHISGAWETIWI